MKAGIMDQRIDIQRATVSQSLSGAPAEAWEDIMSGVATSIAYNPMKSQETNGAPQFVAAEHVEFQIRWTSILADLNAKDRIIYPALLAGAFPPDEINGGRIWNILSVMEIGRREGFKILAMRKAD